MKYTLNTKVRDQINIYIQEAIERGVKFETNAIGDWCREITLMGWDDKRMRYSQMLWISVYVNRDTGRLNVESYWYGFEKGRAAKSELLDLISHITPNASVQAAA